MLKVLGGGVVFAAAGFAFTCTLSKTLFPWVQAGDYAEPRRCALSYALSAPNLHNRQPWTVDLSKPDEVLIYRDKSKNLPETDCHDRQLTIGMGCFMEQFAIAASETGHKVSFDLLPLGEKSPLGVA